MPRASSEIVIKCPRDEVFAFLANPENDPQWRSGVLDLKRVSGSGIGARYAQGVKGPGGRRIPADIEITELTPGKAIAFQTLTGPVRPRGRYVLAAADGGTRVRFELDADMKGLKRLIAPMVQNTMNNEVGQLDRLKRVIEQR